jgi:hypothetical protein
LEAEWVSDSDRTSDTSSDTSKKGGAGLTIVMLLLVITAIGLIGYYAFIETGTGKTAPPSPRPKAAPMSRPQ